MAANGLKVSDFEDVEEVDSEDVASDLRRFSFVDDSLWRSITSVPISNALRAKIR